MGPFNTLKLTLQRMVSFLALRRVFSAAGKQGAGLHQVIIWEQPGISSDALGGGGWCEQILLPFADGGRACLVTFF